MRRLSNVVLTFLTCGLVMTTFAVQADSKKLMPTTLSKSYQAECASCHVAYPPGMLPAQSWRYIMNGLDKHYGVDASIDDVEAFKEVANWLEDHAGTYKKTSTVSPPEHRITQADWFVREHRKIAAEVWLRDAIKRPANCAACHTQAEQFDYRERNISIPN